MSDADVDASSSNDDTRPSATSRKAKGNARHRNADAAATDASSSAASAVTAASTPPSSASLTHANHGRSASSAHICSNTASCPLIAAFDAAAPEDKHKLPLSEDLFACSACRSVLYCSRECQALHWIDGGHKAECPKLAQKWAETPRPHTANAAPSAAAVAASHGAAAAVPRRQYRLNFDIAFGPRSLIVLFLILYLIYRFTRGRSNDPSATHAEL